MKFQPTNHQGLFRNRTTIPFSRPPSPIGQRSTSPPRFSSSYKRAPSQPFSSHKQLRGSLAPLAEVQTVSCRASIRGDRSETEMTIASANPDGAAAERCSLSSIAPVEAVLFDIDGTLCDSDPLHYYAFREMLQEEGYNGGVPVTEHFFVEHISGKHNDEIGDFLFPNDHQKAVKFMEDKEAMFRKLASEQVKPVNGLHKLCQWVKDRGLKRAAVTNAPRDNAELMISLLGLNDFFQHLIIGGECERAKPFPDPYLDGLKALGASASHTFIFEDSVSGIKAGVSAGMPVVGITTRNPENLLMQAKPAFLIKDFEDPKLWMALEELDNFAANKVNSEA